MPDSPLIVRAPPLPENKRVPVGVTSQLGFRLPFRKIPRFGPFVTGVTTYELAALLETQGASGGLSSGSPCQPATG